MIDLQFPRTTLVFNTQIMFVVPTMGMAFDFVSPHTMMSFLQIQFALIIYYNIYPFKIAFYNLVS